MATLDAEITVRQRNQVTLPSAFGRNTEEELAYVRREQDWGE